MIIFLCGFPGVGKTHIAQELSGILQLDWTDLDLEIERMSGKSIQDIFDHEGEDEFRILEQEALNNSIRNIGEKGIISLGGGTVCFMDNLRLLLRQGILVYLREDLKTILERADKIGENRPLFSGLSHSELNHKIETMFLKREPFYRKAQVETLVNSGFSTIILATKLKLLTNRPQSL